MTQKTRWRGEVCVCVCVCDTDLCSMYGDWSYVHTLQDLVRCDQFFFNGNHYSWS